ncbi:uncharacterized protein LOC118273285 [Spodoptera frugiperda]|uniref:Uncharacterized protein LOC118273285 n=1 Tax=Spodoptera frugiperda TaxID=7108 RepID=A0A9R0DNY9_SPOFR|nr:uncharacterized protein LOC118273285 [Spodoptera frugiperda]
MSNICETCLFESKSSYITPPSAEDLKKMKALSAPEFPNSSDEDEASLKPQLSAPSYLHHLRENESPPFLKPQTEPRPHILVGTIMNEDEAVAMIAAADADKENGLKKFIGNFLIEKNIVHNYAIGEKNFLMSLILEVIDYSAQRDFDAFRLAALITIYIDTHLYFRWYYWQSPTAVWNYFKQVMIRHTIEDTPDGEEVFRPQDCYDIITHFHSVYLANMPLIHIITFGTNRLKLIWPFKLGK